MTRIALVRLECSRTCVYHDYIHSQFRHCRQ